MPIKLFIATLIFARAVELVNPASAPQPPQIREIIPVRTDTQDTHGRLIGPAENVERVFAVRIEGKDRAEIRLTVQNTDGESVGRPTFIKVEVKCAGPGKEFSTREAYQNYSFMGMHYDKATSKITISYKFASMSGGVTGPSRVTSQHKPIDLGCP